jgi:hypothetical protein
VVDKVALGQVFSKYFGFPCQFSFSNYSTLIAAAAAAADATATATTATTTTTIINLSPGAGTISKIVAKCQVDSVSPHLKELKTLIKIRNFLKCQNWVGSHCQLPPYNTNHCS